MQAVRMPDNEARLESHHPHGEAQDEVVDVTKLRDPNPRPVDVRFAFLEARSPPLALDIRVRRSASRPDFSPFHSATIYAAEQRIERQRRRNIQYRWI